jgi:hypothetical protein
MIEYIAPPPLPRRGPKPLSDKKKRVRINLRVSPGSLAFLNRLKCKNHGRAVDQLVKQYRMLERQISQA